MRSHISHMHRAVCHVGERIVMGSHTAHKHMKRHVVMGSRISYMWETGVLLWGLISHTCCYGVSYLIHASCCLTVIMELLLTRWKTQA